MEQTRPVWPRRFRCRSPSLFTRAGLRWRGASPFLQWADGVAPRGAKVTYSTVPFFEIETLLLDIVDMTALRAAGVVDTAIAATAAFRALNFIRLQGWFNSRIPSCEHFIRVVRANKPHLPPGDLAVFTILRFTHQRRN